MRKTYRWCLVYAATAVLILGAAVMMSKTATVMAEDQQRRNAVCILIDPGHGGEDGGAVSVTGRPESGYNLEISLRLRDMLHLLGYGTKMTRDRDISIYTEGETLARKKASDLKERVRIINDTENALLVSIHQNFYPEERYSGPQVFFAGTEGSEKLAKHLQSSLSAALHPGSHRQVKKSKGIYLMEHIHCTGVLVECGFLSNYREEAALADPEYQKKLSALMAVGLSQYLSNT